MDFSKQLAIWFMDQQTLMDNNTFQQRLHNMIINSEDFNLLADVDKAIVLRILNLNLSLSFILLNNKEEADELIKDLDSKNIL